MGSTMLKPLYAKDASVLIVEDDHDDATIVGRALHTFGIKTLATVETAEAALAFLAKRPCDIILIDYHLPGMNGLDLLERVHKWWPETVAIVVTGVRDEQVAVSAMKLGAADYVAKDQLLTSGIIRSLQAALRKRVASREEERREALSSDAGKMNVASEEAEWLLDSLSSDSWDALHQPSDAAAPSRPTGEPIDILVSDSPLRGRQPSSPATPAYGDEAWADALDAFSSYLHHSLGGFPAAAKREEDALTRVLMERKSSPRDILMLYRAALRILSSKAEAKATEPALGPTTCLALILARLVKEYQYELSLAGFDQKAASRPAGHPLP